MDERRTRRSTWAGGFRLAAALGAAIAVSVCSDRSPVSPSVPGTPVPPVPNSGGGPAGEAVLVGAGDVGLCGSNGSELTARLLDAVPGVVFMLGDTSYYSGTERELRECFDPSWGRHRGRMRPVPGNHDYESPGAAPYFAYFGAAAGQPGLGYYTYRAGGWQIYALNSNIPIGPGSAQLEWLRGELTLRPSRCALAYWHHPIVTEGPNGPNPHVLALWQLLNEHQVEVALTGHDHLYQRFPPLDAQLRRAPFSGVRQFVVGTGGAMLYPFPAPPSLTEARASVWGVLRLSLQDGAYEWEFLPAGEATFHDTGRDVCH
jgi:hypothetical protein